MLFSRFSFAACFFASAVGALVFAPQTARAQTVVTGYNSLVLYQAATSDTALYQFEDIAPSNSSSINPSLAPLTVTLTGGQNYFVADSAYFNGNYSLTGTDNLEGAFNTAASPGAVTTTIGFGSGITAFGTEFGFRSNTKPSPSGTVSVQLYKGGAAVGAAFSSAVPATSTFIGLVSNQAFDRVVFTSTLQTGTAYQTFDNVRVGTNNVVAASAPEPGTLPLALTGFATGLGIVKAARRRTLRPARKKADLRKAG